MSEKMKRVKIVGDGCFTTVFDSETGEEIKFVQSISIEPRAGLRPMANIVLLTTIVRLDEINSEFLLGNDFEPVVELDDSHEVRKALKMVSESALKDELAARAWAVEQAKGVSAGVGQ